MPLTTTDSMEDPQRKETEMIAKYTFSEEEKKTLQECSNESFWYRSVPFSMFGMAVTQVLVARGTLTASPRFGSLPKVMFAGFCGFLAGKISYMKICQEKFKKLENSPLAEVLRQRSGQPPLNSRGPQSEMGDPNTQSFDTMFQPADAPSQMPTNTIDYGYGYNPEPLITGKADDFNAPDQSYVEEEEPRRKPILYEDLRLKNRENYEVTLTQKSETLLRTSPEKEPKRLKKEMKNKYGDSWEE